MKRLLIISGLICACTFQAGAWLFPEHRDITYTAIAGMDSTHRAILNLLWGYARVGHEARLDSLVIDPNLGEKPPFLDFATWPAIGGDHSVSPADLERNILLSDWILNVADIAAWEKNGIARARNNSERENVMRDADIKLLRADPEYVSRAGSNNGHFMYALPNVKIDAITYFDTCFKAGCPLNTIGIYMWFHLSALEAAQKLTSQDLTPEQKSALALTLLMDEAFAAHFLEDSFSSGHVAGVWGNASQRKGTHDYYDRAGLQVTAWTGERMVILGDAYMRPADAERAGASVRESLNQLLDMVASAYTEGQGVAKGWTATPDTFNTSKNNYMLPRTPQPKMVQMSYEVVKTTPVPGLPDVAGAMPRFNAELGPFVGLTAAGRVSGVSGGFGTSEQTWGAIGALEMAVRVGLGMDGVVNESGDGLIFLDFGLDIDASSSMSFSNTDMASQFGGYSAAIPSRGSMFVRFRMPFYLIPGDLIVMGPILYFAKRDALNKMIVKAGNGGVIPWQSGITTGIGRFQFVLGREIGIYLYGRGNADPMVIPTNGGQDGVLCKLRTTQLNFPIVEYRIFRTYAAKQGGGMMLQLNGGVDIPGKRSVVYPEGADLPPLKSVWMIGLRLVFDYRHYLAFGK